MEKYKHLLPTKCPPPHIIRIILDFILKHSTFNFMDTHIHQVLGTSMGTTMAPPCANLFLGKEEHTIILTFLHSIYFWKRFIDDIFIFHGSHTQLQSLMTFMNTIIPTIKYTFTYSEQTASFLDVQIYLSESRKLKTKLYKKPFDCMALLHFHSHHPLSCKEGIVYPHTLRYDIYSRKSSTTEHAFYWLGHTCYISSLKTITCYPNEQHTQKPTFSLS